MKRGDSNSVLGAVRDGIADHAPLLIVLLGVGLIAGMGLAIIAMIADRMTQSWSQRRQEKYGILIN